jgi:hypothetical protein
MSVTFEQILQLLQTASIILAIIVAAGTLKGRGEDKTKDLTEIKVDLKYIKEQVEKIPDQSLEIAMLRKDIDGIGRRLEEHISACRGVK